MTPGPEEDEENDAMDREDEAIREEEGKDEEEYPPENAPDPDW